LFKNVSRKAKPTSLKMSAFSAQMITVRGLITVEMSPSEGVARVGDPHHLVDDVAAGVGTVMLGLASTTRPRCRGQIIERGDDRPAVHLRLVDLLTP
jgi:hypothetical protein